MWGRVPTSGYPSQLYALRSTETRQKPTVQKTILVSGFPENRLQKVQLITQLAVLLCGQVKTA